MTTRWTLGTIGAVALVATLGAADAPNTLTAKEKADGWQLLFDGATLAGWRGWKQETAPEGWQVKDGTIARGARAGDLITVDEFESFDFAFDWRIAKNGNSGVFFHVVERPDLRQTYASGPEYQLLDNDGHPDAKNGPDRYAGANYALHPPAKNMARPIGEWNQSRIVVDNGRVEHWLNGEKVVEYELWSADWKARVAASKFNAMPMYGQARKGHLALQDHGDEVAFRSLKIKRLPAKAGTH